jgi:hypothetical protein
MSCLIHIEVKHHINLWCHLIFCYLTTNLDCICNKIQIHSEETEMNFSLLTPRTLTKFELEVLSSMKSNFKLSSSYIIN